MQTVFISAGTALCRYCGEQIAQNSLSTHIATKHRRPAPRTMEPTLVKKAAAASPPPAD
jgi:hypothetical protein